MHKNGMEDNEKWNLTVGITNCFIGVTQICRYIFIIPQKKLPMHTNCFLDSFRVEQFNKDNAHTNISIWDLCGLYEINTL